MQTPWILTGEKTPIADALALQVDPKASSRCHKINMEWVQRAKVSRQR